MDLAGEMVIQYGFAGFSVALLSIVVWMFKGMLTVQRETNEVIQKAVIALDRISDDHKDLVQRVVNIERKVDSLSHRMIARPCIAKDEK